MSGRRSLVAFNHFNVLLLKAWYSKDMIQAEVKIRKYALILLFEHSAALQGKNCFLVCICRTKIFHPKISNVLKVCTLKELACIDVEVDISAALWSQINKTRQTSIIVIPDFKNGTCKGIFIFESQWSMSQWNLITVLNDTTIF